jgi:hypothetical protein
MSETYLGDVTLKLRYIGVSMKLIGEYVAAEKLILGNQLVTEHIFY